MMRIVAVPPALRARGLAAAAAAAGVSGAAAPKDSLPQEAKEAALRAPHYIIVAHRHSPSFQHFLKRREESATSESGKNSADGAASLVQRQCFTVVDLLPEDWRALLLLCAAHTSPRGSFTFAFPGFFPPPSGEKMTSNRTTLSAPAVREEEGNGRLDKSVQEKEEEEKGEVVAEMVNSDGNCFHVLERRHKDFAPNDLVYMYLQALGNAQVSTDDGVSLSSLIKDTMGSAASDDEAADEERKRSGAPCDGESGTDADALGADWATEVSRAGLTPAEASAYNLKATFSAPSSPPSPSATAETNATDTSAPTSSAQQEEDRDQWFYFYPFRNRARDSVVFSSPAFVVLLSLRPVARHHLLIVPRRVVASLHRLRTRSSVNTDSSSGGGGTTSTATATATVHPSPSPSPPSAPDSLPAAAGGSADQGSSDEVAEFAQLIAATVAALRRAGGAAESRDPAPSFSIAVQQGRLAGQTVPHLHLHVIPMPPPPSAKTSPSSSSLSSSPSPPSGGVDADSTVIHDTHRAAAAIGAAEADERGALTPEAMRAQRDALAPHFTAIVKDDPQRYWALC